MSQTTKSGLGKRRRISFARQFIIDVMAFSKNAPLISIERTMQIATLVEARQANPARPPWSGIFAKGFAIVARQMPELRRAYLSAPFPHIFEFEENVVAIAYDAALHDEATVLPARIKNPENWPLAGFRFKLDEMAAPDLWQRDFYRTLRIISYLPAPFRRLIWWFALNVPRLRKRWFGTFLITSVGELGADLLNPIAPISPLLTYGPIDPHNGVRVRLIFDHRIFDGATAARALARLEESLLGPIVAELRQHHSV
jgi:hypothetical protein